jgi:glycosyltransferase involved in cell wall biosynthesis
MKVLFVCSGNSEFGIRLIKNQGDSLKNNGVDIHYFPIIGKGFKGYLSNVPKLKKTLISNKYDIVHAHYSLSAMVASLSGAKPLIVSLMGSDVQANIFCKLMIRLFSNVSWSKTIVKSSRMKNDIGISNVVVIPNGVDLGRFEVIEKNVAKRKIGFNNKRHIIFVSDPDRYEKNYQLAKSSFDLLKHDNIELNTIYNINNDLMPYYYYGADLLLLTSLWEGSPNVIKEAMACNLPIVSTNVGDVKEILGATKGCYICSYDPKDVANKIKMALEFGKRTNGRERIKKLGLDSESIAMEIIKLYKNVIQVEE